MKTKIALLFVASALCADLRADQPSIAVTPRNSTLTSLTTITNGQTLTINSFTNLVLTPAYQHDLSVFTQVISTNSATIANGGFTNTVGSGAATYTNYFDLAKVISGVTNWTTDTPIKVTGTLNGLTPVNQAAIVQKTSFDGFDLIRLTKTGHGATNTYQYTVTIGQTP